MMILHRWRSKEVIGVIFVLCLGQVVSVNHAITSFTSSLLANLSVDAPLSQSLFTYGFLALVYTPIVLYRRQKLVVPWYWYLLLAIIDVQANYLVVQAYQYSSITSVTILDCWTTPWVMILTWIYLGTQYSLCQFFGAAVCAAGLCLVLLSDSGTGGSGGKNPLLGDVLVVLGTLCYAMSNVGEEYCVKRKDLVEVLSMLGVFGLLVSLCEIFLFETKNLEAVKWSPEIVPATPTTTLPSATSTTTPATSHTPLPSTPPTTPPRNMVGPEVPDEEVWEYPTFFQDAISLFGGFALSTFIFYSIVPYVLKLGGSALFNLSLLTSDFWAVIIRIFIYHQKIDWLYYVAFVVVAIGLIIYSVTDKNSIVKTDVEDEVVDIQYQVLNEENAVSRNETLDAQEIVVDHDEKPLL